MTLQTYQDRLLVALRQNGGWMTRADIAKAIGVKKLCVAETLLLDDMADKGEIERRTIERRSAIAVRYEYRINEA